MYAFSHEAVLQIVVYVFDTGNRDLVYEKCIIKILSKKK